jgi:hypothetical protein
VWNQPERAQALGKERVALDRIVSHLKRIGVQVGDAPELLEMADAEGDEAATILDEDGEEEPVSPDALPPGFSEEEADLEEDAVADADAPMLDLDEDEEFADDDLAIDNALQVFRNSQDAVRIVPREMVIDQHVGHLRRVVRGGAGGAKDGGGGAMQGGFGECWHGVLVLVVICGLKALRLRPGVCC